MGTDSHFKKMQRQKGRHRMENMLKIPCKIRTRATCPQILQDMRWGSNSSDPAGHSIWS